MNYVEVAQIHLQEHKSITHKDILRITNGNCSYSTLRGLKRKMQIIGEWEKNPNTKKRYMRYFEDKTNEKCNVT